MDDGLILRLKQFLQRPFRDEMDIWNVILLTILVVTIAIFWSHILRHITEA
jgi:hypothetical protein